MQQKREELCARKKNPTSDAKSSSHVKEKWERRTSRGKEKEDWWVGDYGALSHFFFRKKSVKFPSRVEEREKAHD